MRDCRTPPPPRPGKPRGHTPQHSHRDRAAVNTVTEICTPSSKQKIYIGTGQVRVSDPASFGRLRLQRIFKKNVLTVTKCLKFLLLRVYIISVLLFFSIVLNLNNYLPVYYY